MGALIRDSLFESDVDDNVKQELFEYTILCQRLNSCDVVCELIH